MVKMFKIEIGRLKLWMSGQVNDLSMSWELRVQFFFCSDVEVRPLCVELSEVARVNEILGTNERSL